MHFIDVWMINKLSMILCQLSTLVSFFSATFHGFPPWLLLKLEFVSMAVVLFLICAEIHSPARLTGLTHIIGNEGFVTLTKDFPRVKAYKG